MAARTDEPPALLDEQWGRRLALVAGLLGVAFLLNPLYVFPDAASRTEFFVLVWLLNGVVALYGVALLAVAYLGRHGRAPAATAWAVGVGVAILLLGPVAGFPLGLFSWVGLALAATFAVGVPSAWRAYRRGD